MRSLLVKAILFLGLSAMGSTLFVLPYLTISGRSVSAASSE